MKTKITNIGILPQIPLFQGINKEGIEKMISCLNGYVIRYEAGDMIQREREPIRGFGIVLNGRIHLEQSDFWGNRNIISDLFAGEILGIAFGAPEERISTLSARAAEDCSILYMDMGVMTSPCHNLCPCHTRMIRNLVTVLTNQADTLTEKMEHLSKRTTRRKVMSYLSQYARKTESTEFEIPFDRQELADYLFVERSALSGELGRMKREGLIDFRKNRFILKQECEQ